ncbi:aldolase [Cystobasidium minutum MCA 4210]|uniref:aldolase n=1 Tax=Cystobasidium minutum MCA 4210 TaxID=1397322 RepID=UPI0034CD137D|eukprot:jgi/Rhomi1/197200/gm1.5414_g
MTTSNGSSLRPFPKGVYTPLTTPFTQDEEVDYNALVKQVIRLAKAKMGIVLLGTNGEAIHLSDAERQKVTKVSREALDKEGFNEVPILVGTGAGSAKETIKLCVEAKEVGADAAIVIHPGYFAFAMGKNRQAVKDYFISVLDKSPLPVMIYNFPGAASGIDLDSDILIELSEHPNCMGAKLTCAGIGKGTRLAAHTQSKEYLSRHAPFHVFPGFSDYMLPAAVSGHTGVITGTGNLMPKLMVKLWDTSVEAIKTGDLEKWKEAQRLQLIVSNADWCVVKAGIGGTKYAMDKFVEKGLGGRSRLPIPEASPDIQTMCDSGLAEAMQLEASL